MRMGVAASNRIHVYISEIRMIAAICADIAHIKLCSRRRDASATARLHENGRGCQPIRFLWRAIVFATTYIHKKLLFIIFDLFLKKNFRLQQFSTTNFFTKKILKNSLLNNNT